jgi:hypothetical protein
MKTKEPVQEAMKLWKSLLGDAPCPEELQFRVWLSIHPAARLTYSIAETATKYLRMKKAMNLEYLVRFCSAVANSERRFSQCSNRYAD